MAVFSVVIQLYQQCQASEKWDMAKGPFHGFAESLSWLRVSQ